MTAPTIPECDTPQVVYEELMEEIRFAIDNHPRSLQSLIGPSELGEPCNRALIAKLMGVPDPPEPPNWRATVGTAIHSWMEETFTKSVLQGGIDGPRFLLEQRVTVGQVGGVDITGSCDLFDTASGVVWDWKTKSKSQLAKHRRHGPGERYRTQFHCYGRGMADAGHRVTAVGMICLPRDGSLDDAFMWAEPYNEQVARDALARCNELHALAKMLGTEAAQQLYPPCDSEWCRTCRPAGALAARFGHGTPARKPGQSRPASLAAAIAATK